MRYSAKEILGVMAKQLGNTPAVCKKAYVHPAVLALGSKLAGDAGAMNDIWQEIAGRTKSVRRLHSAEARLLAFLHRHWLESRRAQKAVRGAQKQKAQPFLVGLFGAVRA
ncbi:hypothetical protein [Variovorax sp. LjRoot84]|uniref:hypothetical protein n=1 Tax=Variovorax sp. LjRoot84 TaxID=3342340 RepID=UPI003F51332F